MRAVRDLALVGPRRAAMNWDQARKLFHLENRAARSTPVESLVAPPSVADEARVERTRCICVASGKGGTGKSVVTASLAACFARRARTLVVDADLGVGNAHILQGIAPPHSLVDVVEGKHSARDVRAACSPNLDLLAAGSGISHMASLHASELAAVAGAVEDLASDYGWILLDSGAGISPQTVALASASDWVLLVTTPDVTALTDAYAFLKVLLQHDPRARASFVVNRASSLEEGALVAERLQAVARKYLGQEPRCVGVLPDDRAVGRSVNARRPAVEHEPHAAFAREIALLAGRLEDLFAATPPRGRRWRFDAPSGGRATSF